MVIYKITNLVNGKVYIGQSTGDGKSRWAAHCSSFRRDKGGHLHRAMRKYGLSNFSFSVLENSVPKSRLNSRERFWIKELRTMDSNFGYNLRFGGSKNMNHSSLTKKKIAKALVGNKNWSKTPNKNWLTVKEVKKRLLQKHGGNVSLDRRVKKPRTFKRYIFIDKEYGSWRALLGNVIVGYGHPERGRIKRLTTTRVKKLKFYKKVLYEKTNGKVTLVESSYRGALKKAEFIDVTYGTFFAFPANVIHKGTGHKERAERRRSRTTLRRYGVKWAMQNPKVAEKYRISRKRNSEKRKTQ